MVELINEQNYVILRCTSGENLVSELQAYIASKRIPFSVFTVIGATNEVVLSFYDLSKQQYVDTTIKEDLEIVSVSGNSSWMSNKIVLHLHGVFARRDYSTIGGHIKKLIISATGEITVRVYKKKLQRSYDHKTGLNLLFYK